MHKENLLYLITYIIRIGVLLFTIFLIFNGFGIYANGKEPLLYMYANLTNLSFWVIFMMGAILLSPFGRFFCAICPVGEINYLSSKIGLKKILKGDFSFLQGFSLLLMFILVVQFHFSRHPHTTSLLLLSVIILSALMGLIFRGNTFCTTICPANGFLRFYGRLSLLKITCHNDCKTSPCMVFLNPCDVKKEQCHLCFRCFKNAKGLSLKVDRNPFKRVAYPFTKSELFIFTVLTGLTFMAFIRVIRPVRELFVFPPYLLAQSLDLSEQFLLFLVIFFGVIIYPAVIFTLYTVPLKIISKKTFFETAKAYLPFIIPTTLAVHLILAVTKINSRINFLAYALSEPSGKDMVELFKNGKIEIPGDLINISYFKFIPLLIPILSFLITTSVIRKEQISVSEKAILFSSNLLFLVFIEFCVLEWLFKGILL